MTIRNTAGSLIDRPVLLVTLPLTGMDRLGLEAVQGTTVPRPCGAFGVRAGIATSCRLRRQDAAVSVQAGARRSQPQGMQKPN